MEHGARIRSAEQRAMALEMTRDELLLRLQRTELKLDALNAASSAAFTASEEKLSELQVKNVELAAQNKALQAKCDALWEQAVTGRVAAQQQQLQLQQQHRRLRLPRQQEQKVGRGELRNVSAADGTGVSPVSLSPISKAAVTPVLALSLASAQARKAALAGKEDAGRTPGLWR